MSKTNNIDCICGKGESRRFWKYPYGPEDFVRFCIRLPLISCALLTPFLIGYLKDDPDFAPVVILGLVVTLWCYSELIARTTMRKREGHKFACAIRHALLRML
jgi:hypothetical protein